jgi:glucan phosphoethanolaminetransferase (alkaline phosphatase superfamily)
MGVIKLKKLNAAAIVMCIIGAFGVFQFVWAIAATESFTQMWAEMMGTTASESAVLTMAVLFYAVYHFIALALLAVVAVIPLRRAEKWAWFTILVFTGIGFGFGIALWAPYFPFMYALFAMWIAALALSAKPCLQKKG